MVINNNLTLEVGMIINDKHTLAIPQFTRETQHVLEEEAMTYTSTVVQVLEENSILVQKRRIMKISVNVIPLLAQQEVLAEVIKQNMHLRIKQESINRLALTSWLIKQTFEFV